MWYGVCEYSDEEACAQYNEAIDAATCSTVIDRVVEAIEWGDQCAFTDSGVLCEGTPFANVFAEDAIARSGDGFILKAGYDHFLDVYARADMEPVACRRRARNAATYILEFLNEACKKISGMSLVSIADDGGSVVFVSTLKTLQRQISLLRA